MKLMQPPGQERGAEGKTSASTTLKSSAILRVTRDNTASDEIVKALNGFKNFGNPQLISPDS